MGHKIDAVIMGTTGTLAGVSGLFAAVAGNGQGVLGGGMLSAITLDRCGYSIWCAVRGVPYPQYPSQP